MSQELGLRERKKQATRQLIADTARRLFVERGFERVRIAEIARAADVSEQTVFNYFPHQGGPRLLAARELRGRAAGGRPRARARRVVPGGVQPLRCSASAACSPSATPRPPRQLEGVTRMISESPALLAREEQIFDRYTESLSALIAERDRRRAGRRPGRGWPRTR